MNPIQYCLPKLGVLCLMVVTSYSVGAVDDLEPQPPVAEIHPTVLESHGVKRTDNYYWLRERENPKVIAYLEAENEYTEQMMSGIKPLEDSLFEEIKGRIKQDDSTVPYLDRGYIYYTRFEEGLQYPIFCRRADQEGAIEEVMLDVNQLAEGKEYCSVSRVRVSPDSKKIAFSVDFTGRRKYNLRFKDLSTGQLLPDEIDNISGGCVWAADSETVFFTRKDPVTLRAFLVVRHRLGASEKDEVAVFEETDEEFSCGVMTSRSREYIFIASRQTISTEYRYLAADDPTGEFKVFQPRTDGHEYSIDHLGDRFYIRSNDSAKNFRLFSVQESSPTRQQWAEVVPHRDNVLL
ncbi:MAG: oligopeptidase B, partial [Planctomycetota bacterium]